MIKTWIRAIRSYPDHLSNRLFVFCLWLLVSEMFTIITPARSAVYGVEDSEQTYLLSVKPVLEKHCYACHGGLKQEAGLRLDTVEFILNGGDSGPILDTQNIELSELLRRIQATDDSVMPPKHEGERLKDEQVIRFADWLRSGVKVIPDEQPSLTPSEHWAFQKINRPSFPSEPSRVSREQNRLQEINPIDRFLFSQSEATHASLQADSASNQLASRITLLRRLSIDLRGLPLEGETVASLIPQTSGGGADSDGSTDFGAMYEAKVEEWLADRAYGERWGRHWMDVWRYSDWWGLGEELRNSQLHMWHWRDWIIESLNSNVPYDEMLRQMIAADELYPDDLNKLRATGFLARNYFLFNRNQWMEETVEHVGKGMLGLTMNCAKCHDHKYDPISQVDYYRFRAIFEPYHVRLDMVEGESDLRKNGLPRIFDRDLDSPTYLFLRGEESKPDKTNPLAPGIPSFLAFKEYLAEPIKLPRFAYHPDTRDSTIKNYVAKSESRRVELESKLQAAQVKIENLDRKMVELSHNPNDPLTSTDDRHVYTENWDESTSLEELKPLWNLYSGDWSLAGGQLHQTSSKPDRAIARLVKENVPNDFIVDMKFSTTGGNQWKSVGISFDCTDVNPIDGFQSGDHEVSVYASAYDGEQKIQIAYVSEGQWVYPADAKVLQPIVLNQPNDFRLVVRDRLVNVHWNGKLVLAWTLPFPRQAGVIQLTTFDALASFDSFTLRGVDEATVLRLPNGEISYSDKTLAGVKAQIIEAKSQAELAALELDVAKEELAFHQARLSNPESATSKGWAVATAAYKVASAQFALDRSDEKSRDQKSQEVEKATQFQEKVSKGDLSDFQPSYPGAKWSATRFQFSGKDDPEKSYPESSSGRRRALAQWITSPDNPLTARVAVNHIWMRHFGTPLVQDAFDFGMKSKTPEHIELLNWLAAELIEKNWDMKHLHRLIVQSSHYKQLHRSVPRLESQIVRDSVLALAGTLDRTMGGPAIPASEQPNSKRRSLYFFHSNNERNLFLTMFDEALVTECYRRDESIVPQQALAMSHSRIILENVSAIAGRIRGLAKEDSEQFTRIAFMWILGLDPTEDELQLCRAMIEEDNRRTGVLNDEEKSVSFSRQEELIWVLLNHHHFLQVP
ncbi:MAG: PSD1 and planctomycete cytochrome C domain-containing protein [Pirellula sp.]